MPYEDQKLNCVQCGAEFTFTAGEQEFYAQKGFSSPPKRCKSCRNARRRRNPSEVDGIYRSPAFEGSAPAHQKIRGRSGGRRRGYGERGGRGPRDYRSPSFGDQRRRPSSQEYRSPAFREYEHIKPEQEYRSPGFREYDNIKPEEEYRAPGFKEHADIDLKAEYRSPGFSDLREKYRDEKPTFMITCAWCGKEESVTFLPEEKEEPLCKECFAAKRKAQQADQEQQDSDDSPEQSDSADPSASTLSANDSEPADTNVNSENK